MKGKIFNIQRFCTSDGPGIRTTVFLKGCPLKCLWCHNPESQELKSQLLFNKEKCVNCLKCIPLCDNGCHYLEENTHKFDRNNCISCGKCINTHCEALEISGYDATVDEIINEIIKDKEFYDNSLGGITLSGGEPLYQSEFSLELLKQAKAHNLNTAIETCGFAKREVIKKFIDVVDLFLFDYKETNPIKHKNFTGVDNKLILENLHYLDSNGKQIILRCPIIPNYNDTAEHFNGISELANTLKNIVHIEIEPYHSLGETKYSKLGKDYNINSSKEIDEKTINLWIEKIQKQTKTKVLLA